MKRIILILIVFLSSLSYGQNYHKLLDNNIYWDVGFADMGYICSGYGNTGPFRYALAGDTIINSVSYKLFKTYDFINQNTQPAPNCPPFLIDTAYHPEYTFNQKVIMREDTITKKVYKYNTSSQQEILWYDFDAQQGDTLTYPGYGNFIIDTIYNIVTSDGKTRKLFSNNSQTNYPENYYIEGLGGAGGPFFEPFLYFESGSWLMCISDTNQNSIYSPNNCNNFITGLKQHEINTPIPYLYPNPSSNQITIKNNANLIEINIIDLQGKVIHSYPQKQELINISFLQKGIYFIQLIGKENTIVRKFVKE
ncbi:MAG: T9SS type A sorting domain-containing protein [Vicingaceae bacterium]